jgi:phosphate transport system substrate-binding protein
MSCRLLVAVGLILLALLVGCGEPVATREPTLLTLAGSTSMAPLAAELADAYGEATPLARFQVSAWGTKSGLEALREGAVDVALASWLPPDEGDGWQATAVARDAIAVIVHPSNGVGGLGLLQLRDVFGGRTHDWATVGGAPGSGRVQPVSRELGSGTRAAFESVVMEGRDVTPMAILVPSGEAVVEYVASHPEAIGYVSLRQVTGSVKALAVEGEVASASAAGRGSYPIARELWLVTLQPPGEEVERFLRFCVGPVGQGVVGLRYGRVK